MLKTLFQQISMKKRLKRTFSAVSYDIFMKIHEKKVETNVFGHFVRYKIKIYMPGPGRAGFSYYNPGPGRAGKFYLKQTRVGSGPAFDAKFLVRAGPGFEIWTNAGLYSLLSYINDLHNIIKLIF